MSIKRGEGNLSKKDRDRIFKMIEDIVDNKEAGFLCVAKVREQDDDSVTASAVGYGNKINKITMVPILLQAIDCNKRDVLMALSIANLSDVAEKEGKVKSDEEDGLMDFLKSLK